MHHSAARSLSAAPVLAKTLRELNAPHVLALNAWVRRENEKRSITMPWFDPGDAGMGARVLLLLESPGPMATSRGSGLISVDNDDVTAANCWKLRDEAGLRDGVVHWNAVPWFLGTDERSVVAPGSPELRRAIGLMRSLLPLLPELEVVVPMGNAAKRLWGLYSDARPNNLLVVPTWHPSGQGIAGAGKRADVVSALATARRLVTSDSTTPPEPLAPRRAEPIRRGPKRAREVVSDLGRRGRERLASVRSGSRS